MIRQRVLIDIEFAVDETQFKLAQLLDDVAGISDVTETGVCEAVTAEIIHADWAAQGLIPQRSTITTRTCTPSGKFVEILLPADTSVIASEV
jgi:hypothetical protein